VLVLATYVGLYAIYEQLTGNILFVVRENATVAYGQSGLRALRGLFGHPHPFGRVLGIAIPFSFYMVLEEKRARRRAIYLLTLVIMFLGLYLTYRRAAWIAAMASLFLIQLFYPRFRNVFIVLLVVTSAAVYLNRDRLDDSAVSNRVQAGDTSTFNGRTEGWAFAIELWKRRPITGYGYDQFGTLARQEGQRDTAIESQYLSVLVSSGLAGFLPYALLLIMIPLSFVKAFRDRDGPIDKWLIVMYWGAHLSYLVNAYTATVGGVVTTSMLFLLAGALSGVIARSTTADGGLWSVSGAVQP
jgi:O-antigen ligase